MQKRSETPIKWIKPSYEAEEGRSADEGRSLVKPYENDETEQKMDLNDKKTNRTASESDKSFRQNMSTYTGILLDVSGSMQKSFDEGVNVQGGTWIESIFTVIDDFVKHDLSEDNHVFAVGFGSKKQQRIFDILKTLELFSENGHARNDTINEGFRILEEHGARHIRKWADYEVIKQEMKEYQARIILMNLRRDHSFRKWFVNECLPSACRDWNDYRVVVFVQGISSSAISTFRQASPKDIRDVIEKAMNPNRISVLEGIGRDSFFSARHASEIIHSCVDEKGMTTKKARKYLEHIKPYIYGGTPMYAALKQSIDLYQTVKKKDEGDIYRRLLFVLTDGVPTDTGDIDYIKRQFDHKDVKVLVVGCYISVLSNIEPKRLYNTPQPNWDCGAKLLFGLSSHISTAFVTRAIFIKQGWTIDIENNQTRLFIHVNHPENLKSACELTRNAVCCQDALSEVLVSVSLDLYINQKNAGVRAHDQGQDGTCYAHAAATVVHLAMCRILGRDEGYPEFEQLRDDMINRHGRHGANTLRVLQEVCPLYRLHCREVTCQGAMKAVAQKRPVVAQFLLTAKKWTKFEAFYRQNPNSILSKSDLACQNDNSDTTGHAVVLTSYNSECLCLMNSWGDKWGNNGFFRVKNAEVLGLEFIDVYWKKEDLSEKEKNYYRNHGSAVAGELIRSLKALQVATFTCPRCGQCTNVDEFTGTMSDVLCPKCNRSFSSNDGNGNLLALNMYLLFLRA